MTKIALHNVISLQIPQNPITNAVPSLLYALQIGYLAAYLWSKTYTIMISDDCFFVGILVRKELVGVSKAPKALTISTLY